MPRYEHAFHAWCVLVGGQAYFALVLITVFLAAQVYVRPYMSSYMNLLDIATQAVVWLTLAFSILYWHWSDVGDVTSQQESATIGIILIANFTMLLTFVFAIVRTRTWCATCYSTYSRHRLASFSRVLTRFGCSLLHTTDRSGMPQRAGAL